MVSPPCTKRTADVRICTPSFFPVSVMMTPALSFLLNRPVLKVHVIIDSNEKTRIMRVEIDEEAGRLYCLDVMRQCRSDENAIRSARLVLQLQIVDLLHILSTERERFGRNSIDARSP